MDSSKIVCQVFEGLCNRINAMASALATGRDVRLHWAVNGHCPASFEDLFTAIECVKAVSEPRECYRYAADARRICWFYPKNIDGLPHREFTLRFHSAYRRILRSFRTPRYSVPRSPALGIVYRSHLDGVDTFTHFWHQVVRAIEICVPKAVHVATDSMAVKDRIGNLLSSIGVEASTNDCPLLMHDMDRSPENVQGMCRDILSLSECSLGVVSGAARSTVADAAMGRGVKIYYTFDDGFHRHHGRDDLYVFRSVDDLVDIVPRQRHVTGR